MSEFKQELIEDVKDENGLTLKDNKFLDLLFEECKGNIKEAMKASGLSGSQYVLTKRLDKFIKERAASYLAANTARASISLVSILDDPNSPGLKNVIAASKEILDRGGVVKDETPTVKEQNFMFILPAIKEEKEDE